MARINEKQLDNLIRTIVLEQLAQSYQQGQKVGQQAGQQVRQGVVKAGQQVGQAVQSGAAWAANTLKQTIVTIGKITFTVVIIGGTIIYLIGKGVYKVSQSVHNQIMKILSSLGAITMTGVTAVSKTTMNALNAAGLAIQQGQQAFMNNVNKLADNTVNTMKWLLEKVSQYGAKKYAQALAAAAKIQVLATGLGQWFASQWTRVQNVVGTTWEQAKKMSSQALDAVKKGAQSVGSAISKGTQAVGNTLAKGAGNVAGFVQGLFEMFTRIMSFNSNTSIGILNEARIMSELIL
jgi:hypothetical protein